MSEYWKSTPTYWCKFCKVYVRDTGIERSKHEATWKHKGAIERNLRNLHKDEVHKDREKQRAQSEVERLKGIVGGKAAESSPTPTQSQPKAPTFKRQGDAPVSLEERIRQAESAMAMGIVPPEELRPYLAMPGEWRSVEVPGRLENGEVVKRDFKSEEVKLEKVAQPETATAGVRNKRPAEHDEDEHKRRKKRVYLSDAEKAKVDSELENLLGGFRQPKVKMGEGTDTEINVGKANETEIKVEEDDKAEIKTEGEADVNTLAATPPKVPIIFKKRKKPGTKTIAGTS
jgi:hypothetical protein